MVRRLALGAVVTLAAAGMGGSSLAGASTIGSRDVVNAQGGLNASDNQTLNCHGCGKGKTLHVAFANISTAPGEMNNWEHYVANQFTRDTGANISWSTYSQSSQELNLVEVGATTHTGPDVLDVDNGFIGSANAAGAFSPITNADWQLLGGRLHFTPNALKPDLTGGDTVAWYIHNDLLLYNKKLFAQAGISGPPTTWQEYVSDAKRVTALGNGIYGAPFDPMDTFDPWHIIYAYTRDLGGNFINKTATQATLTSPQVVKAVEFWFGLYKSGLAPAQSDNWTGTQLLHLFSQNKLAMLNISVPSNATALKGTPAAHNYAWAPMPTVPVGYKSLPPGAPAHGFVSLQFAYDWGVTSWSHNKALGYRFINIATSPAAEELFYRYTEDLPTNPGAVNVVEKNPTAAIFLKYAAEAIAAPPVTFWGTVETAVAGATATLGRDLQNGTYSQSAVLSALQSADAKIDGAISVSKSKSG